MIKNVIFDIGRVLIGFEWKPYIHSLFDDETCEAITKAMWHTGYWHELDRAVLSEEEILELFYSADPEHKEEILTAFERVGECISRKEYAIEWIEHVKAQGFHVYFLSNYSEHLKKVNPGALDFLPYMDGGVFSCDVKSIKPDHAIYQELLHKYDLDPAECLFIDDQPRNISAAQELGFQAIQFEDYEQAKADVDRVLNR